MFLEHSFPFKTYVGKPLTQSDNSETEMNGKFNSNTIDSHITRRYVVAKTWKKGNWPSQGCVEDDRQKEDTSMKSLTFVGG